MNLTKKIIPAQATQRMRICARRAGLRCALAAIGLAAIAWAGVPRPTAAATIFYYMNESNQTSWLPDGPDYLEVTLSNNGTDVFFDVDILQPLSQYASNGFGIDSFGFNTQGAANSITASNILSLPPSWSVQTNSNQDGFGRFDLIPSVNGGSMNRVTDLTFEIAPTGGETSVDQNLADYVALSMFNGNMGGNPVDFAAHVAGFSVTNESGTISSAYFGGSLPAVPLPGTGSLLLGGLGLLTLLGRRRRTALQSRLTG